MPLPAPLLLKEYGPTLASIIGSRAQKLAEWESFKSFESLPAQLHVMFWGVSMADEEQRWRDTQPPMPVPEGTGLGNEHQGGNEHMDVDVSEDDDVIQGCYSLEIDIGGFEFPRIWIRAEYIRIYDALEVHSRKVSYPYVAPAVVITGQPGIGKTIFIYYALRRRLAEEKPIIWYYRKKRYLFVQEGVYEVPDNFHDFEVFVWTLVDSDDAKDGVPENLVMRHTRHLVIYCTSPNRDRWSRLHKTVRRHVFIMNPWKRKEIFRLASTLPRAIPHDDIDDVFDELGPTPRLCIDYLGDGLINDYRNEVQDAISMLEIREVERMLQDSRSLTMNAVSHKICLIRRQDREDMYSGATVSIITSSIDSRLANRLRALERGEQIRLYKYFSKVRDSRGTAGMFFEAAAQGRIQDGITLEFLPMVRLSSSRRNQQPQWYSSHVIFHDNDELEAARQQVLQEPRRSLHIPEGLRVEEYTDNVLTSIEPNVIYMPELQNQVALDSFIFMNDHLYIFQFSIGGNHDIKRGFLKFIRKYLGGFPPMDKWDFVFVHPSNHTLVCPQPRLPDLQTLRPLSVALKL